MNGGNVNKCIIYSFLLLSALQPKVMDNGDLCVLCDSMVAVVNAYMSEGYTEVSEYIVCTINNIGIHIYNRY